MWWSFTIQTFKCGRCWKELPYEMKSCPHCHVTFARVQVIDHTRTSSACPHGSTSFCTQCDFAQRLAEMECSGCKALMLWQPCPNCGQNEKGKFLAISVIASAIAVGLFLALIPYPGIRAILGWVLSPIAIAGVPYAIMGAVGVFTRSGGTIGINKTQGYGKIVYDEMCAVCGKARSSLRCPHCGHRAWCVLAGAVALSLVALFFFAMTFQYPELWPRPQGGRIAGLIGDGVLIDSAASMKVMRWVFSLFATLGAVLALLCVFPMFIRRFRADAPTSVAPTRPSQP